VIHTRGLTRHFRVKGEVVEAVRGIDIDVEEGELVAFLGPNGAGKSTSLRMLTTLLPPTAGTAIVAGCDIRTDPLGARRRIGPTSCSPPSSSTGSPSAWRARSPAASGGGSTSPSA